MEKKYLHLLINEEIYVLEKGSKTQDTDASYEEKTIPIAFIHQSSNQTELELLDKIVAACKLGSKDYKILQDSNNMPFKKGVIFTSEATDFYHPVRESGREILYSKPLETLMKRKEDKAKLWESLKKFL